MSQARDPGFSSGNGDVEGVGQVCSFSSFEKQARRSFSSMLKVLLG
jgi:hypothetical protein